MLFVGLSLGPCLWHATGVRFMFCFSYFAFARENRNHFTADVTLSCGRPRLSGPERYRSSEADTETLGDNKTLTRNHYADDDK